MEVILLMYIYGFRNVLHNIEEMKMRLPAFSKFYWLTNWLVVTPIVLAFITIVTWINFTPCYYGDYVFPSWVQVSKNGRILLKRLENVQPFQAIGWMMAGWTVVLVLVLGVLEYFRRNYLLDKPTSLSEMFSPVDKFGPAVGGGASAPVEPVGNSNLAAYDNDAFGYGSTAKEKTAASYNSTHM